MIKQIWIAECDICGKTEKAQIMLGRYYNDNEHTLPDGWIRLKNKDICICPDCASVLKDKIQD